MALHTSHVIIVELDPSLCILPYIFFEMSIIFQKCFAQTHSENIVSKYFENKESSLRLLRPFECEYCNGPCMYYYVITVIISKDLSMHYLHLLI